MSSSGALRATIIGSKEALADPWKKKKIENLRLLLAGALTAQSKVGLKMNIPAARLADVVRILPSMRNPTISSLSQGQRHGVGQAGEVHCTATAGWVQ